MKILCDTQAKKIGFFYLIATTLTLFAIYFYEGKQVFDPMFLILVAIPIIRNGIMLVRSSAQKDALTFHMALLGTIFFIVVAIFAG